MRIAVAKNFKEELKKAIKESNVTLVDTDEEFDFVCLEKSIYLGDSITLKADGKYFLKSIEDILYFRMIGNQLTCSDGVREYKINLKLYQVEQKYQHNHFIRVSKSDVVNIKKVEEITVLPFSKYELLMEDKEKIYVTRSYYAMFKNRFGL